MSTAHGTNPAVQQAASDAAQIQDAVNLIAIVGCFQHHLLALREAGASGDDLNNHPVVIAFISKLNSLCRLSLDREMTAFAAIDKLRNGEDAEYDVIPL